MMNAIEPNSTRSPGRIWTGSRTSHPFNLVPLWDPRSLSTQPSSRRTSRACIRDTDRSVRHRSQSRVRPMVNLTPLPGGKTSGAGMAAGFAGGASGFWEPG